MKVSTRCQQGLRILLQIGLANQRQGLVHGRDVAGKLGLTAAYLEQIMMPLKAAGLVRAMRGPHGGYGLNVEPESITVLAVVELFDGPLLAADGEADGTAGQGQLDLTALVWQRLAEACRREAAQINLHDLLLATRQAESQDGGDYVI